MNSLYYKQARATSFSPTLSPHSNNNKKPANYQTCWQDIHQKSLFVFYIQENLEVIFKFKQTGRKDNEKWTIFSLRFCSFSIPEMTSPSLLSFSLSQDIVSLCNPWVAYMFSFFHCHHHYYHYHFGVKLTMG